MNRTVLITALLASVTLATMFIRIPLPGGGYFNFGDVGVVFAGLVVGSMRIRGALFFAALIGGLGSAIADAVGGYLMFAPITFVAKALEGGLAGYASRRGATLKFIFLAVGGALMVATYFLGEWALPTYGLQGAIRELIPNAVQAGGGLIGGLILHSVFGLVAPSPETKA